MGGIWCAWRHAWWSVRLEGLRRGQDDRVLGWCDHGCLVDDTLEGRWTIRAAADAPRLDSVARRGDWRGRGPLVSMRGQTCKGGRGREELHKSGEMMHGGVEMACQ